MHCPSAPPPSCRRHKFNIHSLQGQKSRRMKMEQRQSQPCQYPVGTDSESAVCGKPTGVPTEVGWDGMTTRLHLCPEHSGQCRRFLSILRTVYDRFEEERAASGEVDEPRPDNREDEESTETSDSDWVCDRCGEEIPKGNPFFSLDFSIEYVDSTTPDRGDEIEVVHSENLMTLCGPCGNRYDWDRLFQMPAEFEPDRSATCNTFETQVIAMLLERRRISRDLEAKLAALEQSLGETSMKLMDSLA